MLTLPETITPSDVEQWLSGGWCLMTTDDNRLIPAQLMSSGRRDSRKASLILLDGTGVDGVHYNRIHAYWPPCGAVNVYNTAVFVNRIQRRQYRRTYNHRCVELSIVRKWEAMKLNNAVMLLDANSPELVGNLFNPVYDSVKEAEIRLSGDGFVARAVNPYLVLCKTDTMGTFEVVHREVPVGLFTGGRFAPYPDTKDHIIRRVNKHLGVM